MTNQDLDTEIRVVHQIFETNQMTFVLKEVEEAHRTTYEYTAYLLAKIYIRADWAKIARNWKIKAEDVFQHKVKAAACKMNVPQITDKLCNLLGLQSVIISTRVFDTLQHDEATTINILRKESIYVTRKAIELANFLRDYDKQQREKRSDH